METTVEHFEFQTEARQLLDLMIHSVYSRADIFLRELVSNSSDALDKRRIESLRDPAISMPTDASIRLLPDAAERTLAIVDNGIGMSHDELVSNLGTIARSGTREFLTMLKEGGNNAELIGQFGVGFYASFMVADRVTVISRRAGSDETWRWESTGDGTFSVEPAEQAEVGTTVVLHLKPADQESDRSDYTDPDVLRGIVRRYSDFVSWPIRLRRIIPAGETVPEGGVVQPDGSALADEVVNSMKALWRKSASEITDEEHADFYRHLSHDWNAPLRSIVVRAEGTQEYYALLYLPAAAPVDLYLHENRRGLHLYVRRVFIMDDARDLLPSWLRFVSGVVDSEDLPLNISREILQQNGQVRMIRRRLTTRLLESMKEIRENDPEKFASFWNEMGKVVKEGIYQDPEHADAILDVALFATTGESDPTTLAAYVERMKEGQEEILYITGEDRRVLETSPHIEGLREEGIEVLIMTDPVDELWTATRGDFRGKRLHNVLRGTVRTGTREERERKDVEAKEKREELAPLLTVLRERLAGKVKDVRPGERLRNSPACMVTEEGDISPQLQKILRAMGQGPPEAMRVLEINPGHPLIQGMTDMVRNNPGDPRLAEYADLLLGGAILAEGGALPDPAAFSRMVADLMIRAGMPSGS